MYNSLFEGMSFSSFARALNPPLVSISTCYKHLIVSDSVYIQEVENEHNSQ